jgi:hypothetical protein
MWDLQQIMDVQKRIEWPEELKYAMWLSDTGMCRIFLLCERGFDRECRNPRHDRSSALCYCASSLL